MMGLGQRFGGRVRVADTAAAQAMALAEQKRARKNAKRLRDFQRSEQGRRWGAKS